MKLNIKPKTEKSFRKNENILCQANIFNYVNKSTIHGRKIMIYWTLLQ